MTAHGAYVKAFHAANQIKELGATTVKNIKAMYSAYPLPDDPAMIEELNDIAQVLSDAGERLAEIRERTFCTAKHYLDANRDRVKKAYKLTRRGECYEVV